MRDDGSKQNRRRREYPTAPEIEYVSPGEHKDDNPIRVERNALAVYAEKLGVSADFLREQGVVEVEHDNRLVGFLRSRKDKWIKYHNLYWFDGAKMPRFGHDKRGKYPHKGYVPIFPIMTYNNGRHAEIDLTEGESDCLVMRYASRDAYTFGSYNFTLSRGMAADLKAAGVETINLFTDFDEYGEKSADLIADALHEAGFKVRRIDVGPVVTRWPGSAAKDVRDIFNRLDSAEEFALVVNGLVQESMRRENEDPHIIPLVGDAVLPEWLVPGVVVKGGLNLMVARGKAGKTTLLYELFDIARVGGNYMGRHVEPFTVLLLSEMSKGYNRQFLEDHVLCHGGADHIFGIFPEPHEPLTWSEIKSRIRRVIERYHIDLIVVDTAIHFLEFQQDGINQSSTVREKMNSLREFTEKGITVLVVHHTPHGRDTPLGSVDWANAADNIITITRDVEKDITTVEVDGRNGRDSQQLAFVNDLHVPLEETEKKFNGRSMTDAICDLLPRIEVEAISASAFYAAHEQIFATFDSKDAKETVRVTLDKLSRKGAVKKTREGNRVRYFSEGVPEVELVGEAGEPIVTLDDDEVR